MFELNRDPTLGQLRLFACLWFTLAGCGLGVMLYLRHEPLLALTAWTVTVAMFMVGVFAPKLVKPVFFGMTYLTYPLGFCMSYVMMGLIFALVMVPTSLVMRLRGYDPLHRQFDRQSGSYWTRRKTVSDMKDHFSQY